jgi:hypothetical protein
MTVALQESLAESERDAELELTLGPSARLVEPPRVRPPLGGSLDVGL